MHPNFKKHIFFRLGFNTGEEGGVLAPVNVSPPVISGDLDVGDTLTVTPGTWVGDGVVKTYQWRRDDSDISGATGTTYQLTANDQNAYISCVETATNEGGSPSASSNVIGPVSPILAEMFLSTYPVAAGGSNPVFVYAPPGYTPGGNYPAVVYYHGDGGKGVVNTVTNQSVGTGNGVQTVFGGNFVNTSTSQVLFNSVIVKVNGVEAGRGKHQGNGTIVGDLLSAGTMAYKSSGGAFSVTFLTPPANGAQITITYKWSQLFETGMTEFLNDGDEPARCLIFCPQLASGELDFTLAKHFDDLMTWAVASYSINQNRIYATGLSRGAFMCRELLKNRHTAGANKAIAAMMGYSGSWDGTNQPWASLTNKGMWMHHGTTDTTVTNGLQSLLNSANANVLNSPPETTQYWNIAHTGVVWNDNGYNRKERTDAVGTALYDLFRWLEKYSLDLTEQATLHVVEAERTNNLDDYRRALIQVNLLSAGATKTALLGRLATVKALIGTVYTIDLGDPATPSAGNVNNMTAFGNGAVISNLINDAGGASTKGLTRVAQTTTKHSTFSPRLNAIYHGLPKECNVDGASNSTTVHTGQDKFTGLNPAKLYTIRVIAHHYASGLTTESKISITIGGVTKTLYTEENTYHVIEFTNIAPNGSNEIVIGVDNTGGRTSSLAVYDLIEQP
jgi:poly(3-hydroxybutyrate) depolymerase